MLSLVTLPMFSMVSSIMVYRGMTVYSDTLTGKKETLYLTLSKMILNNTTEQTILFVTNLLAAAALKSLTKERIVISAVIYVIARVVYWIGYLTGGLMGRTTLRAPGFALTIMNTLLLIIVNMNAIIKLR